MDKLYSLIHIYLSPWYRNSVDSYSFARKYLSPQFNMFKWIAANIVYALRYRTSIISKEDLSNKHWLVVSSLNNRDSLAFIQNGIQDAVYVSTGTWASKNPLKHVARLSFHASLLQIVKLPIYYLNLLKDHGKFAFSIADKMTEAIGMTEACTRILKNGKPKSLIFTNDHNVKMRGLIKAANALEIPTIYIQHASVSSSFPPLEFDLAVLEGEDAKSKYLKIGKTNTQIELGGMPKFDQYINKIKVNSQLREIGICTNLLTDINEASRMLEELQARFPQLNWHYRPHPRDARPVPSLSKLKISDSKTQPVFEYLQTIDALIAGETSTHLEAALLNIPSILYKDLSPSSFDDYYGYEKTGLVSSANNINQLAAWIETQKSNLGKPREKTQYYNATVNTVWDGKSTELVLTKIKEFLKQASKT